MLRERLTRHLGAAADVARGEAYEPLLEQLEQRATELESGSHRQRIAQLEAEVRELRDTLEAARAINREVMSELNRRTGNEQPQLTPRRRR